MAKLKAMVTETLSRWPHRRNGSAKVLEACCASFLSLFWLVYWVCTRLQDETELRGLPLAQRQSTINTICCLR